MYTDYIESRGERQGGSRSRRNMGYLSVKANNLASCATAQVPESADGAGDQAQRARRLMNHCLSYKGADPARSVFQLVTTTALFFAGLAALVWAFNHHAWLAYAAVLPPTGLILIRMFIMQHDSGHGSFFASRAACDWTGRFISLFTFLPYDLWRRAHNMHHAGAGNLSRRGAGDVDTLTVREYEALDARQKFLYRLYRHPLVLLVFGPPVYVFLMQRFPPMQKVPYLGDYHPIPVERAWRSAMATNACLALFYGAAIALLGWKTVIGVYVPVLSVAFCAGQWLFFVQHQFEDSYWQYDDNWNYSAAATAGSSYYALPRVLQWLTGNIGFHHVHHLCPSIPNYRLEECFGADPELSSVHGMTIRESLKCATLALWDESRSKMIRFRDLPSAA